jgi:hypothetical protein
MVLSASIDSDEEHLELISEAAIEADWAAAASRGSESDEVMCPLPSIDECMPPPPSSLSRVM